MGTHPVKQGLDDLLLILEDRPCEWGLTPVVEGIRVGAMREEEADEGKVPVVGC